MTNTIYPQSVQRDAYSTCSSSSSLQSPETSQRRTEEIRSKSTVRSRVKAFRVSSILGFKQKIVRDDELQLPYPSSYPLEFMKFSFEEIKTATRNMLNEHVLSVDGCAREFKGWIHEHDLFATEPEKNIPIVIKLIDREEYEDREDEARYLGQLSHPNIVMLYGYCSYKEHQLFVFESMPRKLEDHLFKNAHLLLPWGLRMKVALGVAKGLAYLHRAQVIYREFSTSIIHLDRDYNAKLSDFGIPKDCLTGDKSCSAPEYIATGHQTAKSDVYSFGILLVEILLGRQANELEVESSSREEKVMVKWSRLYLIAKVLNILDPRLKGQYSRRGAQKVAKLALKCLDTEVTTRPNMDGVAAKLEQLQDSNLMEIMECEDESTAYEEVLHMQELVDIQDAQRRKSTAYEEFLSRDGMEEEWDLTL